MDITCQTTLPATGGPARPDVLRALVADLAMAPETWSAPVRFDLTERYCSRLHVEGVDSSIEVWLICWDLGQDTLLHDHGGSAGAFAVASGSLLEDYGTTTKGDLRTRRHQTGDAVGFGANYLHNLVNVSTAPTVTVHAYSPPLRTMNFYCWLPSGMHHLRELRCDSPEPDTRELEAQAVALGGVR